MLTFIIEDIVNVFIYLPWSFLVGGGLTGFYICCQYFRNRKENVKIDLDSEGRKVFLLFLFFVYMAMVAQIALLSREPGSRTAVDLLPFSTFGQTTHVDAFVIENVIMFLPYGFLLPAVCPKIKSGKMACLLSFLFSLGIELTQLITGCGFFQTDDLMTNVLGGVTGYLLFSIVSQVENWRNLCVLSYVIAEY